jgi:hypothetical protein
MTHKNYKEKKMSPFAHMREMDKELNFDMSVAQLRREGVLPPAGNTRTQEQDLALQARIELNWRK